MGEVNRDGGRWGGEQAADQSGSWSMDQAALWMWLAEALAKQQPRSMPLPWRR
jgi:hypothetical protein